MPRKKGWVCGPEVRKNMSNGALNRESRIIKRYGFTKEFYEEQIAAGNIWCSTCKRFRERGLFGNTPRLVCCLECSRRKSSESKEKHRDTVREYSRKRYEENRARILEVRKDWFFKSYGADRNWYHVTLEEQGGGCAICGATTPDSRSKFMFVDHRHGCCATNRACNKCRRGILCNACNVSLAALEKRGKVRILGNGTPDLVWLSRATAYLARYACLKESR